MKYLQLNLMFKSIHLDSDIACINQGIIFGKMLLRLV